MTKYYGLSTMLLLTTVTVSAQDTLKVREQQLDEVVVSAQTANRRISSLQIGAEQLHIKDMATMPALMGEKDILRSVQLLPGVKSESEASSGFQVRGGTSAQNILLFDDMPVYNVSHLAGLFSAFNDDALGSATLYKGITPAQLGGASSAVLNLTGKSGDMSEWHGATSLGLLSTKVFIEGPLISNKVSLLASARRSYLDLFLKAAPDYKDNTLYFYDVNTKLNWQMTPNDQLQFTLFASHDKTAIKRLVSIEWKNLAASLGWSHQYGEHSNGQTSLFFSNYSTENGFDLLGLNLSYSGHIRHTGLRHNSHLRISDRIMFDAGVQSVLMDVKSAEWQNVTSHEKEQRQAWDLSSWLSAEMTLSQALSAEIGVRLSTFHSLGGPYYYEIAQNGDISWLYTTRKNRIVHSHIQPEPRLAVRLKASDIISLKAGYNRTTQNIHALRNQTTSTPFDRYTMSSNLIEPQIADQFSIGIFGMTPSQSYDVSVEGYYRQIDNVLDYRDGLSFSSSIEIERLVLAGKGRSYGTEFCLRKNTGRLTGWLAYTLSWSENKIPGINAGNWYTANNDRRHDINVVTMYKLSKDWVCSAVWTYNSGQAFTAPSGKYQIIDNYIYYYSERNGYRAPDYHRLDVSATWTKHIGSKRKMVREWAFGIYNVYNRMNPYLINFEDGENGKGTKAMQYSLFGIVPSITLTLKL